MNQSIGAAWTRTSKKGIEFLSVTIKGKRYTMFKNTYKKSEKEPDYKIYVDTWVKENSEAGPVMGAKNDDLPF